MTLFGLTDDYILRIKKLVTHEDSSYFHFHKLLGILSLFHFIYRYYLLFSTGSFQINTQTDINLLLLHAVLSGSSMIFKIPNKRNMSSPMIYPEFRLHSILFAYRSIICCYFHYYHFSKFSPIYICFLTMFGADMVTYHYRNDNDIHSTMRNMPFPDSIINENQKKITFFNSSMQIGATIFMLKNIDTAFAPLCAIQLAAFLMTLVRKNIIKARDWHLIYSILLIVNFCVYYNSSMGSILRDASLVLLCKYSRFRNQYNKYICWYIVFFLYIASHSTIVLPFDNYFIQIPYHVWVKNGMITFIIYDYSSYVYKALILNET